MTNSVRFFLVIASIASYTACATFNLTPKESESRESDNTVPGEMNSSIKMRQEVADYAKKFVGTHYKYAGQSPGTGFDCSGFTSYVMKGFGVTLSTASTAQSITGAKVPLERVLPGDLLFFGENADKIQHVALVIKRDKNGITCVHSTTSRGVIVENVSASSYWKPKILFARDVLAR